MPPPLAWAFAGTGNGPGFGSPSGGGNRASLPEIWVSVIVTRLRSPIALESPAL
jgi:hypothetical protein